MTYVRKEELAEGVVLYQGDCLEVLPTLGRFDAVVTDPPYGIGVCGNEGGVTSLKSGAKDYGKQEWDNLPIGPEHITAMISSSANQIIWGGNYFANNLAPSQCWLVWDKLNGAGFSLADVELAWTSFDRAARLFKVSRTATFSEGKAHPTQKPIALMSWCLTHIPAARTVLDPFMGSGTTGVACVMAGRSFVGIEREPSYFDTACRRIEAALKQPDMFIDPPKPIKPVSLFDGEAA